MVSGVVKETNNGYGDPMKQETHSIDRPIAFTGAPAQAEANFATHMFSAWGADVRCDRCDSRPTHVAASYPCGAEVPREIATFYDDGSTEVVAV
jgi:hypothetical protein